MPWISSIAVVLSAALAPPVAPSSGWSEDGSAEAAMLRQRVEAHDAAQTEKELGQRGLVFVGDPGATGPIGTPTTPGTDTPTPDDPRRGESPGVVVGDLTRQAELERIVRKGRRLFIPGIVLATLGTILSIGGIVGVAKDPNPASGGFLGASLALSAIGWPMAIVGIHKRRHPEKYLRNVALSPTGFAVRF